ncbi:HERV-H LTR-associating protein 1 [Pogona vitticeps]
MAASIRGENKKEDRVAVMATAELPAKSIDLAAINLTELVNGMLNTALKGTSNFFSLLSITSYSSYAFHKVSIVIYNISNMKNVDPTKFPMRHCYCLNNRTNDLTDFTALLVDIVGNTTNYLTEIFKSTSIVSVSQSNDTDCIYICVMSGRTGRNLSDLWEAIEKSPVINYTFSGNVSDLLDLGLILPGLMPLWEDAEKVLGHPAKNTWTFKTTKMPMWAPEKEKGKEILLTLHPVFLSTTSLKGADVPVIQLPLEVKTDASKGYDVSSTERPSEKPPSATVESYGSPPETMPIHTLQMPTEAWSFGMKEHETTLPQVTVWQKTAGLEGSDVSPSRVFSWLSTDPSRELDLPPTKRTPPQVPLTSYDIPSGTQPLPVTAIPLPLASPSTEQEQDALKPQPPSTGTITFSTPAASSKITKAPHQMQTGKVPLPALVTPPQKPAILLKGPSRCPQPIKKGASFTTPSATVQKINPCVMELCKFYQQCLCARDRIYSRQEAMRYCIENYSWFLRNAAYVCEKVKRTAYSKTLKQKCLASICKSI